MSSVYERARQSRDRRFDGRFYVGVKTTGIYCRPICPAVSPRRENVQFFSTAAAAGEAGFRPCLRCRPESAPGSPAWNGTSTTVTRGLRLIADGALDQGGVEQLAERLGVTGRHLRRLFSEHVGASPQAIAHTRRLHFAKSLIDQTELPMVDIAIAAGYGSTRRFNDAVRKAWRRSPRELRRRRAQSDASDMLTLRLAYREPYDWQALCRFFSLRALDGVETVENGAYRRVLRGGSTAAVVELEQGDGELLAKLRGVAPAELLGVVQTLKDVLDVDAPIDDITAVLSADPKLAKALRACPGIRVPGVWDRFEHIVRAVLGQQVSVKAATTLAGRIAMRYGERLPEAMRTATGLSVAFPSAERLKRARLENLGVIRSRAATIRRVASAVVAGDLLLDPAARRDDFLAAFTAIKGIGRWTAEYALLRAMKDPNAFPATDLGIVNALATCDGVKPKAQDVLDAAQHWQPWRAYAAMLLWTQTGVGG
ncbi:MAG: Ada metal-binding domain-containing protein [Pseudomonadota bacterium]